MHRGRAASRDIATTGRARNLDFRSATIAAATLIALGCGGSAAAPAPPAVDRDAQTAAACGVGNWELQEESAGPCGVCGGNPADFVDFTITPDLAVDGGAVTDSEGNTWQFDPGTCSLTLAGQCDASDAIDFATGQVACTWTCAEGCPACPAKCQVLAL